MKRFAYRHPIIIGLIVGFLIGIILTLLWPAPGAAHPLPPRASGVPGLHLICKAVGKCTDSVPRPLEPCTHGDDGLQKELYDPYLDTYVTWECHCPIFWDERDCGWRRISLSHHWNLSPVSDVHRRWVRDRMRRCPSIVCKTVWVRHYWPTLYALGGRRV